MSNRFKNRYRIPSARAPFWNYGWNAAYFITICTQNRICFFGDVVNNKMDLSPIGHIANSCWQEIPNHFPFVELGAHIIMPNHVHGIIIINKRDGGPDAGRDVGRDAVETQNFASLRPLPQRHHQRPSSQRHQPSSPHPPPSSSGKTPSKNQFGPQSQNLPSIIRGFKTGVTKNARCVNPAFAWQARYHDHVIRNGKSYVNISKYIINNPENWQTEP